MQPKYKTAYSSFLILELWKPTTVSVPPTSLIPIESTRSNSYLQ